MGGPAEEFWGVIVVWSTGAVDDTVGCVRFSAAGIPGHVRYDRHERDCDTGGVFHVSLRHAILSFLEDCDLLNYPSSAEGW
jgi:hypothetical protein